MKARKVISQKITIDTSNFGSNHSVLPPALLKWFQDIATLHANQIGFGWQPLNNLGLVFVISKTYIKFSSPLNKEEVVVLKTIPITSGRFIAEREYLVFDESGNKLVDAISQWCLINTSTRRIAGMDNVNSLLKTSLTKNGSVNYTFEKLGYSDDFEKVADYVVKNSAVDVNSHLNNVEYSKIVIDYLTEKDLKSGISEIEIHYNSEAKLNETMEIYKKQVNDKEIVIIGLKEDKKQVFASKIKLF